MMIHTFLKRSYDFFFKFFNFLFQLFLELITVSLLFYVILVEDIICKMIISYCLIGIEAFSSRISCPFESLICSLLQDSIIFFISVIKFIPIIKHTTICFFFLLFLLDITNIVGIRLLLKKISFYKRAFFSIQLLLYLIDKCFCLYKSRGLEEFQTWLQSKYNFNNDQVFNFKHYWSSNLS
jgi:hypothetical protein